MELERLAELDDGIDGVSDQVFNERDNEIVGLQTEKAENWSTEVQRKKLTVEQKVQKELAYVTQAMDLDPQ